MTDLPTTHVEALLLERAGYFAAGRTDRVVQVDAELARHGIAVEPEQRRRRPPREKAIEVPPGETAVDD